MRELSVTPSILMSAIVFARAEDGRVLYTCLGIDGGPACVAPREKFLGVEIDPEELGLSNAVLGHAARDLIAEIRERCGHEVVADFSKSRIVALVRPEDGHKNRWHGVILSVAGEEAPIMAEGGAESIRVAGGR